MINLIRVATLIHTYVKIDKEVDQKFKPYRTKPSLDKEERIELAQLTATYHRVLRQNGTENELARNVARQCAWQEIDPEGWDFYMIVTPVPDDQQRVPLKIRKPKK